MSRLPAARTVLLFAAPLAVQAGALACLPLAEPRLEEAMPRMLAACVASTFAAWMAANVDNDRGGPFGIAAGLAMASLSAGAFAFAACLGVSLALAGTVDGMTIFMVALFGTMLAVAASILAYVLMNALRVRTAVAVGAMLFHCAVLTPLMFHPARAASTAVTALASAACLAAIFLARRQDKKKPAP
ncbi:MAG TPA: hypothetical protein VL500_06395 [Candidatus Eisenbacteria bacterium]|jgi:hypothetical protein|nr:hypothetical protein [Candidatus Eisenbacteria bacterium]